ncbi:MAG: 1-acyl-sn-glycerol-3-phosphate acyltransferase [Deltaproteobacteria bacterium]|nr:1-acyl-sn-glycerol-3-phosphate acyltransferase [Deltaproteobacteria bacterium]
MIRFLCLNAFIALHTIIMCLWGLLLAIFDRNGKLIRLNVAVPWAKMILWVCGVKVKVKGLENVDSNSPRIYLSNHQSYFDIFTLLAGLPMDFKFLLKHELMKIPFLGSTMKRARYISIDRGDRRKALKSMNEAAEKIKNGDSVLIFPEGTRSTDGHVQPFKKGGFHLALKSGCDIVPVSIIGSRDIVPKGSLRINRGTITMIIGRPVPVKDLLKRDMDGLIEQTRKAVINQMTDQDRTVY